MSNTHLQGLLDSFALVEVAPNTYRAPHLPEGRGVVFGGQLLGQAIVAATKTHNAKRVKSIQTVFAKGLRVTDPVDIKVESLYEGRNIGGVSIDFVQDGRTCASSLLLTDVEEADLIHHQTPVMPDVPAPYPAQAKWINTGAPETIIVGDFDYLEPAMVRPPTLQLWIRFAGTPADDQSLHRALLSHATDGWLIATAMFPHEGIGQAMAHISVSTGVLTQSLAFHTDVNVNDWILIDHEAMYAGGGRVYGRGHAFTQDGKLVASFVQESLVRNFPQGQNPAGKEATIF